MGFLKPKIPGEDPALVAARERETARAKRDKIGLLSQELDDDTRLRLRRFGQQGGFSGGGGGRGGGTASLLGGGSTASVLNSFFSTGRGSLFRGL